MMAPLFPCSVCLGVTHCARHHAVMENVLNRNRDLPFDHPRWRWPRSGDQPEGHEAGEFPRFGPEPDLPDAYAQQWRAIYIGYTTLLEMIPLPEGYDEAADAEVAASVEAGPARGADLPEPGRRTRPGYRAPSLATEAGAGGQGDRNEPGNVGWVADYGVVAEPPSIVPGPPEVPSPGTELRLLRLWKACWRLFSCLYRHNCS